MDKKRYSVIFFFFFFLVINGVQSFGQCPGCVVNTGCSANPAAPTICPDTLPDGTAMAAYSEDISFYLPSEFVDDGTGYDVTLDQMTVLSVSGLPYGMSWETNAVNNIYYPSSNPPASEYGCAKICGTPLMSGNYVVTVFVRVEVTVLGMGQTVDDNFALPLRILPASSSNSSFSINNPVGCVPHSTGFLNNMPSNGNPGFSYLWNFGNGNQSTAENPPLQNYPSDGSFVVTMQTTIDTIGYFLSGVSVLSANGCNDSPFSAPDYYFVLRQGGNEIYSSSYIDNTDPPVSFSFSAIPLTNAVYTIEILDYDTGLAGGDDACGTVTFSGYAAGTQTLTSGSLISTITIDHPVVVINASDTIGVYPSPLISDILYQPNDSLCQMDSILLSVTSSGALSFQWYRDTMAVLNATDSFYFAKQSGVYYCEAMNGHGCRSLSGEKSIVFVENPPKPTFWIIGNTLNTNLTGFSLQWFFEGDPIGGATGMACPVTATGNYALIASNYFGCTTSSDTVFVTFNDAFISETPDIASLAIFPNPNDGLFSLTGMLGGPADIQAVVTDLTGRQVFVNEMGIRSGNLQESFDLRHLESGIYMLDVRVNKISSLHRLLLY